MRNRTWIGAAVLCSFACVPAAYAQTAPDHLRVVWTEDPAHTATISWTTEKETGTNTLFIGTRSTGGATAQYELQAVSRMDGEYVDGGEFFHHATITDLQPATEYFFVVQSDGETSEELSFVSAPDDDRVIKLLYGGDSRSDRDSRQDMNQMIAGLFEKDPEIIALAHGGDYIAFANNWSQWNNWMDDWEALRTPEGRVLPIIPAIGNHEGRGTMYNQVFGNPGGSDSRNYWVTELNQIAFLTLDSERSLAGDQLDFLKEELERLRPIKRWVVPSYHRPAWPAVKAPSRTQEHWVPVFEQFDVDLVCESDGHALKRTVPIRNGKMDSTGVVYVGEGGLGVRQRTPFPDRWYLQAPGMTAKTHHVQMLTFEEQLLRYQAIALGGSVVDELTIQLREDRMRSMIAIANVEAMSKNLVEVAFTKPLSADSATSAKNYTLSPSVDIDAAVSGPEATAILQLVATATLEHLDDNVGLDSRAAKNIVAHRNGPDETEGTADDDPIDTIAELDAISFVGKSALSKLGAAALLSVDDNRNVITLHTDSLEKGQSYTLTISGVTDADGNAIADGSSMAFTFDDSRADAPGGSSDTQASDSGGCSTAGGGSLGLAGLLLLGLVGLRRRR